MTIRSIEEYQEAQRFVEPYLQEADSVDYGWEIARRRWSFKQIDRTAGGTFMLYWAPHDFPDSAPEITGRAHSPGTPHDWDQLAEWAILDALKQIIEWEAANPLPEDA